MSNTLQKIAQQLRASDKKVQLIYAFNGTGKTRLSREFKALLEAEIEAVEDNGVGVSDLSSKNIIYYNAFTEDLFYWDNDLNGDTDRRLKIHTNTFTKWVLEDQGHGNTIIDHFKRLTNSNVEPVFSTDFTEVSFIVRGDEQRSPVKISKGEESNLIWCIFYSFLYQIVEELSGPIAERSTTDFNNLKYVFIDDPVSSLDDNHLIELAENLASLLKKAENLKFIITTHNPLFYNVLWNALNSTNYRLVKKTDGSFELSVLNNDRPFSYHLFLLSSIQKAIQNNAINKYHFNFLRNILEKTATFLGHENWKETLKQIEKDQQYEYIVRLLDLSSHSAHSGEEVAEVQEKDKEKLKQLTDNFIKIYGFKPQ